jgi:hypothetical protein
MNVTVFIAFVIIDFAGRSRYLYMNGGINHALKAFYGQVVQGITISSF